MNISSHDLGFDIEIRENEIIIITIENPEILREVVADIINQENGNDGKIVISNKADIVSFVKKVLFVPNVFCIDLNEKKVLSRLYAEISELIDSNYQEQYSKVVTESIRFIDEVLVNVPYDVISGLDIDIAGFLKLLNVKIDTDNQLSLVEKVVNYLRLNKRMFNKDIVIFLNIKQFLNREEIEELYKFAFYEKISIILIEGCELERYPNEYHLIIDKDKCIIQV